MTAFGYDFNFGGPWWHSYETGGIDGGFEFYRALSPDPNVAYDAYIYHFQDLWLVARDFPVDWPNASYEVSKCLFTLTSCILKVLSFWVLFNDDVPSVEKIQSLH